MIEHVLRHPMGLAHLVLAGVALVVGGAVVVAAKGTRGHRWLGRAYVVSMVGVNLTAFLIYELFGGFGLFHWMALASLATVVVGYLPARRRRSGWRATHAYFMTGSYVGLVAALVAETFTRTTQLPFLGSVAAASTAVICVGVWLMLRLIPRTLSS